MIDTENTEIILQAGRDDDSTAADVQRCLKMLYSAHPGEQALDRDFGIDREPLGAAHEQRQSPDGRRVCGENSAV